MEQASRLVVATALSQVVESLNLVAIPGSLAPPDLQVTSALVHPFQPHCSFALLARVSHSARNADDKVKAVAELLPVAVQEMLVLYYFVDYRMELPA